ncbi:MAG: hypothetical protein ACWGQW_16455 [bacterium]
MKVLHLIRSKPDEETVKLIAALSEGNRCRKINLFNEKPIDYEELVKMVFAAERVISWW